MGMVAADKPDCRARRRGACRLAIVAALSLALSGCAIGIGSATPAGPGVPPMRGPLAPDGVYNPDTRMCRNYRAYHSDCRRRHAGDDGGDGQQGSDPGDQGGATQPGKAASSA